MIPLTDCKHGMTYLIRSRNLRIGVFNSATQGFMGIRTKFGSRYLFEEYHADTGAPFGTVYPQRELEPCPLPDLSEEKNPALVAYLDALLKEPRHYLDCPKCGGEFTNGHCNDCEYDVS